MLDKSATDDQLLDALRAEISRLKGQLQQTQQQLQAQQLATAGGAGRSVGEGISTKFSMAGSTLIGSTTDKGKSVAGGKGGALGGSVMADSLDFLQAQQLQQQQESYEAEIRQLQAEVVRLRRLCKNQVSPIPGLAGVGVVRYFTHLLLCLTLRPCRATSWRRRTGPFGSSRRSCTLTTKARNIVVLS